MYDPKLREIEETLVEREFPKIFAVELNADCNLNCSMCHHDQMRRPKGVMPHALWRKLADEVAARQPTTDVWFSFCGEPLLSPERLLENLDYGRAVGLRSLNLNTNAAYLTPEIADRLLDASLTMIVIGIDGFSAPVYEAIRVNARRDEVYANVESLLKKRLERADGPEILVQFIEMEENIHEVEAFKAYWLERGATVKVRNMLSWGGKFVTPLAQLRAQRIACPWAMNMMHVFWDGRVPRCPGDTEGDEQSGNAWEESLEVLWAKLGYYRSLHLSHRFDELPDRCQTCTDWMTGASVKLRPSRHGTFPTAPVASTEGRAP